MKKKIKIVVLTLAISLFVYSLNVGAQDISWYLYEQQFTNTLPYSYEIAPGSEEWLSLSDVEEKREACYVSVDFARSTTTSALLETILSYPLLVDIFAFDSLSDGIDWVSGYFPCLSIFLNRDTAERTLIQYLAGKTNEEKVGDIYCLYATSLLNYLYQQNGESPLRMHDTFVQTPRGSYVSARYDTTWEYWGSSLAAAQAENYAMQLAYPNSTSLAGVNPKYNCHSYAWHEQSTTNRYWVHSPIDYISDGSYSAASPSVGARITYASYTHSGIITGYGGSISSTRVTSKWGTLGLYSHYANDCPYYSSGTTLGYWR